VRRMPRVFGLLSKEQDLLWFISRKIDYSSWILILTSSQGRLMIQVGSRFLPHVQRIKIATFFGRL
jgi:hypothetical protein